MINYLKALAIIALWIAAALIVIWATDARAAAVEWRFDCGQHQVRFGLNSLTIDDRETVVLLTTSPGVAEKPDGHRLAVTTYEFEGDNYLVLDDSGDPDVAVLVKDGDAVSCDRY